MFDLDDYTPYLLNRAGVCIADAFGAELKPHGLNIRKWRVLAALWHRPDQRLGELGELTSLEISTLSRIVGALQGQGLVTRSAADDDGRSVTIRLTEAGRKATGELIPLALDYEAAMFRGFAPGDLAALKDMLRRAYGNLAPEARRARPGGTD